MIKSNNTIIKTKNINWKSIREISYNEDSPCIKCLVNTTCSRSFTDGKACRELAEYVRDQYNKQK